ncbi:hypothetical protein OKW10_000797 [Bacillus pumilus]|nr:hypothetical protein [Bacillus pumilus]
MSGTTVGEIVARLTLESSQFSAGVSQAESQMNQMSNSAKSLSTQMGLVQNGSPSGRGRNSRGHRRIS